jgi:alpha-tubulin suppressor-like RCC1 family protein
MSLFSQVKHLIHKPFYGLLVVGVLLNSIGGYFVYQRLSEVTKSSQALITNTWTVWGNNSSGKYCDGSSGSSTTPRELGVSGDIVQISQGFDHVLAIRNDNTLKVCGDNSQGQLGNGTTTDESQFVNNTILSGIQDVVAADQVSYALTTAGDVYEWGDTINGQVQTPTQITGLSNIVQITASSKSLLARTATGDLYGYGLNQYGELGDGTTNSITTPTVVETNVDDASCSQRSCGFVRNQLVFTSGDNADFELANGIISDRQNFAVVPALLNVNKIISSPTSSNYYALRLDGSVWSWGSSSFLGYTISGNLDSFTPTAITGLSNIQEVSAGFPLALDNSGNVFTWATTSATQVSQISNGTTLSLSSRNVAYVRSDLYNPIVNGDIAGLTVSCNPTTVNTTTTCTFVMPPTKDLPPAFVMTVGNAVPGGICTLTATTITCVNVPVGTLAGSQPIRAQIGTDPIQNTGENAVVSATVITGVNIANQSGSCTPNPVDQASFFDCSFPLTGSSVYSLPLGGLRATGLAVGGNALSGVGSSDPCYISANSLICENLPTIFATDSLSIGMNEVMVYEPLANNYLDKASIAVQGMQLNPTRILASNDCQNSSDIQSGQLLTCTFPLTGSPTNTYSLPVGGVRALIGNTGSLSPACSIINNGSPAVYLSCPSISSSGISEGVYTIFIVENTLYPRAGVTIYTVLDSNDLANLNVSCDDSLISTTTTCTFNLPNLVALPSFFALSVGSTTPGGACTENLGFVTCINVPTSVATGIQPIYAQINPSAPINTNQSAILRKYLENSEIEPLEFSCQSEEINATTSCSFVLDDYILLPTNFETQIGNGSVSSNCSISSGLVTCVNVGTGSDPGRQDISAGTGSVVQTGDQVLITRSINQQDITNIVSESNFSCLPNPVAVYSTVNCSARFPEYLITSGSSILANVDGQGASSCSVTLRDLLCPNLNVGPSARSHDVFISLNGISLDPNYILVVSSKLVTNDQLDNIGNPDKEQILSEFKCGIDNIVYAGKKMKCTAQVIEGWVIQPSMKFGIGTDPDGSCTQSGTLVTCIFVPITTELEDNADLVILNSNGEQVLTGITFKVEVAPANFDEETGNLLDEETKLSSSTTEKEEDTETLLSSIDITPRTGGLSLWAIVAGLLGLGFGIFAGRIGQKKNRMIISL